MWANCALQGKRSAHSDMCAQNGRLTEVGRLEKGQTVIGFAQSRHIYTWSHTTYRGARRPPASYRLWCSQPQVRPTCVATFPPGGHSGDGVPACLVRAAGARRGSGRSWTPGSGHGRLRTKTPLRKASRKPIISCEMLAFLSASDNIKYCVQMLYSIKYCVQAGIGWYSIGWIYRPSDRVESSLGHWGLWPAVRSSARQRAEPQQ